MKEIIRDFLLKDVWFYILTFMAVSLITASFLVPPLGIIDNSVLAAVGEMFAFASLGTVIRAIEQGAIAKVKHNNTELTVGKKEKNNDTIHDNSHTSE